jgi:predicted nucleotidyltransferase
MVTDVRSRLNISDEELAEFCQKWKIVRLELFGSALREDFDPEKSDIDLLATFDDSADWGLLEIVEAELQISDLLGRHVDLVERDAVEQSENYLRRRRILRTAHTIYTS